MTSLDEVLYARTACNSFDVDFSCCMVVRPRVFKLLYQLDIDCGHVRADAVILVLPCSWTVFNA